MLSVFTFNKCTYNTWEHAGINMLRGEMGSPSLNVCVALKRLLNLLLSIAQFSQLQFRGVL